MWALKKSNKHRQEIAVLVMRWGGVEPPRLIGTWPSTTPVCQFQHQRLSSVIISCLGTLSSE
jgi:hypothetical protein